MSEQESAGGKRCRVSCSECGELQADTDDGLFSEAAAYRRAGFHEGIQEDIDHYCSVEVVERDLTPQEEWEEHNASFSYEPPELPADAWSQAQMQELFDRVINRRVQWTCQKCSGHGPIRSLQKARRHVERNHMEKLLSQYETPREEQEAAADGGTPQSDISARAQQNHGIGDFSGGDDQ
jgi:hypothetical protein